MTQKRLRNPYFMPSGFTQDDLNDLYWRTPVIKQVLKDIKDRKRHEQWGINIENKMKIIDKNNLVRQPKKTKSQKLSEQIQYGYDICKWWGEQHES